MGVSRSRREAGELVELLVGEVNGVGSGVLLDVCDATGAGDRGDVVTLSQQPCQRHLGQGGADLGGDRGNLVGQAQVVLEVVAAEPGVVRPEDARVDLVRWSGTCRSKSPGRGGKGTKPIFSSRSTGRTRASGSRVNSEYSDWTAVTGWTA